VALSPLTVSEFLRMLVGAVFASRRPWATTPRQGALFPFLHQPFSELLPVCDVQKGRLSHPGSIIGGGRIAKSDRSRPSCAFLEALREGTSRWLWRMKGSSRRRRPPVPRSKKEASQGCAYEALFQRFESALPGDPYLPKLEGLVSRQIVPIKNFADLLKGIKRGEQQPYHASCYF